jgi:hypothetical protein
MFFEQPSSGDIEVATRCGYFRRHPVTEPIAIVTTAGNRYRSASPSAVPEISGRAGTAERPKIRTKNN